MKLKVGNFQKNKRNIFHEPTIPFFDTRYRPKVVSIDTECTGLNWAKDDRPFALGMSWYDDRNFLQFAYWDWPVNPKTRQVNYFGQKGLNLFTSYYCDPKIDKVFANRKYDQHMIAKAWNIYPKGKIHDVLVAAWACNTLESSYKLNDLAEKYLNVTQEDESLLKKEIIRCHKLAKDDGIPTKSVYEDYFLAKYYNHNSNHVRNYNEKDTSLRTLDLWYFYEEGMKELGVRETYDIEMEVADILFNMEERGVRFFEEECLEEIELLNKKIKEQETLLRTRFANPLLNINSEKQLRPHIYKTSINNKVSLNLPIKETTKKGNQPSLSAETLKRNIHIPEIEAILKYRGYVKGITTCKNYLKSQTKDNTLSLQDLPWLHQRKAIYPNFNQIAEYNDGETKGAKRTGRLSASNPNLQNVADPAKSSGVFVTDGRKFFGPREGYVWYCIDYSQLELRIFAERTKGKLYDAFLEGRDPHDETRRNVPYLAAMEKERGRKIAKNTNFSVINMGGPRVLYIKYNVPLAEGKIVIREFYEQFPETTSRQLEAQQFAIEHGYIETLTGRRINVDLTRNEYGHYLWAYRATAYDIQGSAADIIKRAMIEVNKLIAPISIYIPRKIDAHLVLSIHDEIVVEVRKEHAYKYLLKDIISVMENVARKFMTLPLECEMVKTYKSWSSYDKIEVKL